MDVGEDLEWNGTRYMVNRKTALQIQKRLDNDGIDQN